MSNQSKTKSALAQVMRAERTLIQVKQGTPEWKLWAQQGITEQDVSAILGENPWKTAYRLWAEKVGLIKEENLTKHPDFVREEESKDAASEVWQEAKQQAVAPVCIANERASWLKGNLDGVTSDGQVLHITCPSTKKMAWFLSHWNGEVIESWEQLERIGFGYKYAEIQYLMAIAGCFVTSFWVFDVTCKYGHEVIIPLNEEYAENMLHKAQEFWGQVKGMVAPAIDPARDVLSAAMLSKEDCMAWVDAEEAYTHLDGQIRAMEAQLKALKDERRTQEQKLAALAGDWPKVEAPTGFKLTVFTKQGAVDYKAAIAALAPQITESQLDSFRKASTTSVCITVAKA